MRNQRRRRSKKGFHEGVFYNMQNKISNIKLQKGKKMKKQITLTKWVRLLKSKGLFRVYVRAEFTLIGKEYH